MPVTKILQLAADEQWPGFFLGKFRVVFFLSHWLYISNLRISRGGGGGGFFSSFVFVRGRCAVKV